MAITEPFVTTGKPTGTIPVTISHRIIQLFSEGLYTNPNKAIEELVSNSFDAGAQNVHVLLSPDLRADGATIVVIDDGDGMNKQGLENHWIIGKSTRRINLPAEGRIPIGRFGIGKLATYILASHLTHISKIDGKYCAVSMDYTILDKEKKGGIFEEEQITLPFRELSAKEAESILAKWTQGNGEGYKALKLFGPDAKDSWTVAIMSQITDRGKLAKRGQLKWILRTAMPLRPDFNLYFDGGRLRPAKIDKPHIHRWIIGKDLLPGPKPESGDNSSKDYLGKPCPKEFELTEDESENEDAVHRFGLTHPILGRITGYVELYEDSLIGAKSARIERSHGFFVYVRERLINIDDPGFGIERNLLRHGTFSRLRVVVYIDGLDEELRSSRESVRQGEPYELSQNFLHAIFNFSRNQLIEHEESQDSKVRLSARFASTPGSLTRKPLIALIENAITGDAKPKYVHYPEGLAEDERVDFRAKLQEISQSEEGMFKDFQLVELNESDGIAVYDASIRQLQINLFHPFVASFLDEFQDPNLGLPLQMFCTSEILHEANLYYMGIPEDQISEILATRDELFRQLVRSTGKRNVHMVSTALQEARNDEARLEEEMLASFEMMGYSDVIPLGMSGKPDGTALAPLPAAADGAIQRHKVGLEAKSGSRVSAKRLDVSGIGRHMEDYGCDHHIVIGNGFATSTGDDSASVREIEAYKKSTGKTITLMEIDDFAKLVRLVVPKRVGLSGLRDLYRTCTTPEASRDWVERLDRKIPEYKPYKEILDTIWELGSERQDETIAYASVTTALRRADPPVDLGQPEVKELCKGMEGMAPGLVFAREYSVEINVRPDKILDVMRATLGHYPDGEQENIKF